MTESSRFPKAREMGEMSERGELCREVIPNAKEAPVPPVQCLSIPMQSTCILLWAFISFLGHLQFLIHCRCYINCHHTLSFRGH